jgi:hypothetical protein
MILGSPGRGLQVGAEYFDPNLHVSGTVMICFSELYLDSLFVASLILYGKEDLSQSLTPDANIFLKRRTVSQYFQDVTGFHVRGPNSYL